MLENEIKMRGELVCSKKTDKVFKKAALFNHKTLPLPS